MAQRDWTSVIALANRLIERNGRSVMFSKEVQAVPDAAKPWRTIADPPETQTLNAVFVPDGSGLGFSTEDVDLFRDAEQIAIVAPEAVGSTYDLSTYNQITEASGRQWRFSGIMKLQPGDVVLLYFIGMKR